MKTFRIALVALLLAASSLPLLRGDMPAVQTGQWAATGAMSDARGGASAALLPNGLVLVTGGTGTSGVLATAELFGPDGQFTAAGTMLSARADHASVVLGDGRVLVVGGRTSAGAVAAAETFGADGWSAAGQLTDARWGHTATLLADGRVLIVGGENESGLVGSVETFDPATGEFAVAGTLTSPRKGHAAARLADGRVLIVGGFGGGAVLNSINIFDPSTGSISVGPSLAVARAGLSATTLLDGKVLFFGGNDGANDLASAEVFDPIAGTVSATASAATARRDHQAFLLPNNNSVLIVGGASAGTAVASAELYVPWVGQFRATGSMAAARAHATGSTLSRDGLLLVAGGDALASSETYGFATIKTDKDDYYPGLTVTMTGSGWQPGETVTLGLREVPQEHEARTFTAVADVNGQITNSEFVVEQHHLGMRFYLTARGAASQAQMTFTDAKNWTISVAPTTTTTSTVQTFTFTVKNVGDGSSGAELGCATVTAPSAFTSLGTPTLVSSPTGKGWAVSRTLSVIKVFAASDTTADRLVGNPLNEEVKFSITATSPATTAGSPFTWSGTAFAKFDCTGAAFPAPSGGQPTVTVTAPASTTTTASNASATFSATGQPVSLSATVTSSSVVNTGTVTFTIKSGATTIGVPVTSGTVTSGSANATYTLPGGTSAGTYSITAQYSGAPGFASSSDTTRTLTVGNATQTITFGALGSKTYGDPAFTVSATGGASGNPVTFASTTTSVCTTGGTNGTLVTIAAVGSCSIKASQAGNSNYDAAPDVSQSFTVQPKTASVTPNAAGKVYGAGEPTLSGTLVGFLAADGVTAVYSRTANETVAGSSTISAVLSPAGVLGNYTITYNTAAFTISPKAASVTPAAAAKVYGDADPALTGTLAGFLSGDGVTAVYSRTASETVAGSSTISAVLSPAGVLGNYTITYNTAAFTISPRPASVTPNAAGKVYGDTDPALSGTLAGFLVADGVTAVYSRTANETVAGSSTISAVLNPAGVLSNYTITSNTAAFTISPRPASATPNAAGKVYGDTDPALTGTLAGFLTGDGVTAVYSRTANETVAGTSTISAVLSPAGVLANYTVTYNTSAFTISPKPASVTPAAAGKVYGDAEPALTGTLAGFLAADGVSAIYSRTAGETVGASPYTISAALSPAAVLTNYTITANTAAFAISPKPASVSPATAGKIYGDVDPALSGALTGFLTADGVTATYSRIAGETVGASPYTISAALSPAGVLGNYAITANTAAFAISPKPASVSPAAAGKVYGDLDPALSGALTGFLTADGVTATYGRIAGETVGASPYTISAVLSPAAVLGNYAITANTAAFTISPKPASVSPAAAGKVYGDVDPALSGALTGFLTADGVTATYSRIAGETVGASPYTISAALSPAGVLGNYAITSNTAAFAISPKPASVSPAAAGKVYGDVDPALSGALTGFLTADGVTATYSRIAGETVGASPYTISAVLSPAAVLGNYAITANTAAFTISPKPASVSPAAAGKVYGDVDPALSGALTGFLTADGVTATYGRIAGETVGASPYTISAALSPAGVLGNYAITANTAAFAISPKPASVSPAAAGKVYGDADPALSGALTGFLTADGVTATYSRIAGETVGASPYTISAALSPAGVLGNYAITANTAAFAIGPKAASVTPAAAGKVYGDADPALTGTLAGFLSGDGVSAVYSRTANETVAGSSTISAVLSPGGVLGNYTITANTAAFTISPKAASVSPAAAGKVYGDADPALTGTLAGFLAADGVSAVYSRTANETVAGSSTISAILSPAGVLGNYAITANTAAFAISPKAASVTPAAAGKVYGDADPALTGTLAGFLSGDGVSAVYSRTANETVAGSSTISAVLSPAGVLGNYTITANTAAFTISPKAASVTPAAAGKVYGDADPALTGTLAGFLSGDGVTAVYSRTANETVAGSSTISAVLSPGGVLGNYTITANTAAFTISPKAASVTPAAAGKVYGDADPALTGTLAGFLSGDGVTAVYSRTANETVAGSSTISAILSPAGVLGNYTITANTAAFTISPKTASVTPAAAAKVYGDADPALTGTLAGFLAADGVSAVYSRTANETVAGSSTISAILSPAGVLGNYTITANTAAFTISPKAASVSPAAAGKVYGDADPALTGTLAGFLAADGVSAVYSRTANETVAGSSTISAVLSPAGVLGNYTITANTAAFTISPKAASVSPAAAGKVYGEADPALTGTLAGFLAADGVSAVYSRTANETVAGSSTISAILSPAGVLGNYTITANTAAFTISPKTASVSPAAAGKVYGDADPALTGTLAGFLAADGVSAVYSRTANETVAGSSTISAILSPAGVLGNYTITANTAAFTISPKAASVSPAAAGKVYGDADPALTGTLAGFLAADGVSAVYSRTAGENVVGTYTISAALSPLAVLGNYTITSNTAAFTISPKAVLITPDVGQSKVYGTTDPALCFTNDGGLALAAFGISKLDRALGENVGNYAINLGSLSAGPNYTLSLSGTTINFGITLRPVTVTPSAGQSKMYGAADPTALAYSLTTGTLVTGDSFTGALSRVAGENVGSYAIQQGTLALSANYTLSFVPGSFAITSRPVTVAPVAGQSKMYGTTDPTAFAYSLTAGILVTGDSFTGVLVRAVGEHVGAYTIQQGTLALSANYTLSFVPGSFAITQRPLTITAAAKSKVFGASDPPLTFTSGTLVTGDALTGTLTRVAGEAVGTYAILLGTVSAGPDYLINYVGASLTISSWSATGFYQPVTMTAGVVNTIKGGSTVPLKFNLYTTASHTTELTNTSDVTGFAVVQISCGAAGTEDPVDFVTTGGTSLRYSGTPGSDGQFIQNWQTPKPAGNCYRVTMTARDATTISALFKTK